MIPMIHAMEQHEWQQLTTLVMTILYYDQSMS